MAGILEFVLGLNASEFTTELGKSAREVLKFGDVMEIARVSAESMFKAIERGAALQELSARTGESVANLYRFEEALKSAGLGADSAGPMIFKLQKALSGLTETGESKESLFARLGLDRKTLAAEDPIQALLQISDALAELNSNQAAVAAGSLFGREGAGEILQMAGSTEDMARAFADSRDNAILFGATSKTFKGIEDAITSIRSHTEGIWAGLASAAGPELQKVLDEVSAYTSKIGLAIMGAFQFGDIKQLLADAVQAGIEQGSYYASMVFDALAAAFGDAIYAALQVAVGDFIPMYAHAVANAGKSAYSIDAQEGDQESAAEYQRSADLNRNPHWHNMDYANRMQAEADRYSAKAAAEAQYQSQILNEDSGRFKADMTAAMVDVQASVKTIIADVATSVKNSPGHPHAAADQFLADLQKFSNMAAAANPQSWSSDGKPTGGEPLPAYKPEVSDLEKIGFIFGNGISFQNDAAQTTAKNTGQIVDVLTKIQIALPKYEPPSLSVNLD